MASPMVMEPAVPMPADEAVTSDSLDAGKAFQTTRSVGSVEGTDPATATSQTGGSGPRVIRTADLSLIVADGGFGDAFDNASLVAKSYDGFVVDSSTAGTKAKAGTLVIRVPSDSFDDAMSDLRGLGEEIERQDVTGTDVTDQFVDLEARLRSWQAQERVLLKLMAKANTINETMQVQNELQRVRYEIESIQGQLRVLRDQTSLATISVSMHERGAAAPKFDEPEETVAKPSIVVAWEKAVAGFLGVISAVIVGLGYLIPLAAIGALGYLIYRKTRRHPGDAGATG